MMRSCQHGIVDKAVNMHHGETFRHTHFMHLDLPEKACTFLCGDVICRYWDWAKKVASLFPEYKPMVEGMKPFLGRMHAKVHVWYCQVEILFWNYLSIFKEFQLIDNMGWALDVRSRFNTWGRTGTGFLQNVKIRKCNKAYGDCK